MKKLTIVFTPCSAPEVDLTVVVEERFEEAPMRLFAAMNELYGPFNLFTAEGTQWFEIYGDVLQHLGQAFALIDEGDNPAVIVRSVPGDEESNYTLTVAVE